MVLTIHLKVLQLLSGPEHNSGCNCSREKKCRADRVEMENSSCDAIWTPGVTSTGPWTVGQADWWQSRTRGRTLSRLEARAAPCGILPTATGWNRDPKNTHIHHSGCTHTHILANINGSAALCKYVVLLLFEHWNSVPALLAGTAFLLLLS